MKILGLSALFHDASAAFIEDEKIVWAGHAERYDGKKLTKHLNSDLIDEGLRRGGRPDIIAWYENPWKKKVRQLYAGEYKEAFSLSNLPSRYLKCFPQLKGIPIKYCDHHYSHACAGYFTSTFNESAIVVIDAIGEWDTATIWHAKGNKIKKIKSYRYPNSLGLLYTAFTVRAGLRPVDEEYILMGMAGWGEPKYAGDIMRDFIALDFTHKGDVFKLRQNVHRGIGEWFPNADLMDLAASIQKVTEQTISMIMQQASELVDSPNLCYQGGVSLNCVANHIPTKWFDNVWIMPNPGDSGNALGAALAQRNNYVKWQTPYLGTNIPGIYPVEKALDLLLKGEIFGIASGPAEYGPRALGNRSLVADPRGPEIKDRVNEIKRRQKFRPFAPVILEEYVHDYFEMPTKTSPYMQFTGVCKYPNKFPAITHIDGTSRVQTVSKTQNKGLYSLIKAFMDQTGCPMILNTSLNIRGKPMVNTREDADAFEKEYGITVVS